MYALIPTSWASPGPMSTAMLDLLLGRAGTGSNYDRTRVDRSDHPPRVMRWAYLSRTRLGRPPASFPGELHQPVPRGGGVAGFRGQQGRRDRINVPLLVLGTRRRVSGGKRRHRVRQLVQPRIVRVPAEGLITPEVDPHELVVVQSEPLLLGHIGGLAGRVGREQDPSVAFHRDRVLADPDLTQAAEQVHDFGREEQAVARGELGDPSPLLLEVADPGGERLVDLG